MDHTRNEQMALDDHLLYPLFPDTAGVEWDIQHLDLIYDNFQSQVDHRDRFGLGVVAIFFEDAGNGETANLSLGDIIGFFQRRGPEIEAKRYRFFFVHQPGASNRIWMPCTQVLLSTYQINPSFPHLVGRSHLTGFGSYVRLRSLEPTVLPAPQYHESWWSISAPRSFRRGGVVEEFLANDGWRKLFDIKTLDRNGWALLMWRMSLCIQYDISNKTSTVIALDDGGNLTRFTNGRFMLSMGNREQMYMKEDPFVIHVLFLTQTIQDWTFSFEVLQKELDLEENRVFRDNLGRDDYEAISLSLHDLVAYQLKYQIHIALTPTVIDSVIDEHRRLKAIIDIPDYAFERVERLLRRLKVQAQSNYEHSLRMEKQTKNIQDQLIDLTNLTIESNISRASADTAANTVAIAANTDTVDHLIRSINEIRLKHLEKTGANGTAAVDQEGEGGGDLAEGLVDVFMPGIQELIAHSHELSHTSSQSLKSINSLAETSQLTLQGIEETNEASQTMLLAIKASNQNSVELLKAMQAGNDRRRELLDLIHQTNDNADRNLAEIRLLVGATQDQGHAMHAIAAIMLWMLLPQILSGFVSMQILNWGENKSGPFLGNSAWAFAVYVTLLAVSGVQALQIARKTKVMTIYWPWSSQWIFEGREAARAAQQAQVIEATEQMEAEVIEMHPREPPRAHTAR